MAEHIIAACDGASKGNPGPAAWAWVMAGADGTVERWEAGPLGTATNNVAELTALQKLLEAVDPAMPLQVRMDSQYAMKAVTTWLPGWRKKGWKTSAGTPVANRDLVVRIDELLTGRTVEFVYVPAHQVGGDPFNAVADQAASHSARTQQAVGTSQGSTLPPPDTKEQPGAGRRGGKPGAPAPRDGQATRGGGSLKAKFPGRCRCGQPYGKGETIAKNPEGWGHLSCATTAAAAG
ncbi:ribonuclease H [Streptomyces sp. H10-C2]|uniref:ribonuclease H family protein n=1 Tax=unclassified Streptomyces TaxID=2593676 RepID=UPI0024BBB023|nr:MULTISPECIES: ribonuclease H [unclassified Streptomyces]MDJ0343431.1 ribonuclease H [Streptomyces sp. PH10-H1]MDJ0371511.1 ribonuclease H [Streptomyces sp. H10-C2]